MPLCRNKYHGLENNKQLIVYFVGNRTTQRDSKRNEMCVRGKKYEGTCDSK